MFNDLTVLTVFFQILKAKLNLPPYLTNEARGLIKKVSILYTFLSLYTGSTFDTSFKELLKYLILCRSLKSP